MGFETKILSVVEEVVGPHRSEFSYGTLWVSNCTESQCQVLIEKFQDIVTGDCKIFMTPQAGNEFSFDFGI